MSSLALVHVDLGLERFDFFSLDFKQLLDLQLFFQDVPLFLVVFIDENGFHGIVQLAIELKFCLTKVSDQVKEVRVVLHFMSQFSLGGIKLGFSILNVLNASLLSLLESLLQIQYHT